ncbi:MAG TPA: ATP-binding protein, partial [Candidatus Omnitrophota bacterium]|nr:ATP-binding protein [Candidatus Omnitrophota bacterium]
GKPLKVLIVEDSEDDAELMIAELMRGGFAPVVRRVDTLPDLQAALAGGEWEVVLSDCHMPHMSADLALTTLQQSRQDLPFIILSGVVRPEDAVSLLKRGAHDFINKDALARLVPAVERELREASERAQRRAAEQRVRILSLAVEQSPVSVVITGRDGTIEYVNPKFEEVTGYSFADSVGRPLDFTRDGEGAEAFAMLTASMAAGEEWRGELSNRRRDGQMFWERVSASPLTSETGAITHFVVVKEDITERRLHENELREALDQLTQTNTELERFAYVASHDLQEPLRTVTLYCQLLDRDLRGKLSDDADDYLHFIVGAAKRMHALINDLLAYSRITGGLPFTPVRAADACASALQNLQESIRETGASIEVRPLPVIAADQVQLMQLFQNLIGNAIKFHRPDVAPRIVVSAEQVGGEWVFSVADNGIGIEASEQDVFEIFRRLHTAQAYPGTGVGLAICKRIVQRHGGSIWMTSQPGQGSTFFFTLAKRERA